MKPGRCVFNPTMEVILYADLKTKIARKFGFSLNQQSFISTNKSLIFIKLPLQLVQQEELGMAKFASYSDYRLMGIKI